MPRRFLKAFSRRSFQSRLGVKPTSSKAPEATLMTDCDISADRLLWCTTQTDLALRLLVTDGSSGTSLSTLSIRSERAQAGREPPCLNVMRVEIRFEMRQATRSAFKNIKVWQSVET